jgi:hypothetical protein
MVATEVGAYHDRVDRRLWRRFRTSAPGMAVLLAIGLVTSVLADGTLLVTPIVLGTTINAVFAVDRRWVVRDQLGRCRPARTSRYRRIFSRGRIDCSPTIDFWLA